MKVLGLMRGGALLLAMTSENCEDPYVPRETGDPPPPPAAAGTSSGSGSTGTDSGADTGSSSDTDRELDACCGPSNGQEDRYCVAEVEVGVAERPDDAGFYCRERCIGTEVFGLWCFDDGSCCEGLTCDAAGLCR